MIRERPRARALRLLRAKLSTGGRAGQALAPERELAEDCGVSRTTMRWALAKLAAEGLLGPVVGRTRLVAKPEARRSLASNAVYLFSSITDFDGMHSVGWGGQVHLGVQHVLRSVGRSVLIPGSALDETTIATVLRERPVGVVLPAALFTGNIDPALDHVAATLAAAHIPTVAFGEEELPCDRVVSDHAGGAYALSTWLLSQGRRRHLCLWPGSVFRPWQSCRLAGHERALREAGLPPPRLEATRWSDSDLDFDSLVVTLAGHLVPHLLTDEPVDAVLALIDSHVPAICAALRRCGREPGREITVVGYDANWSDAPERRHYPLPPAATVDKDNRGIGRAMAQLLEDRIAGRLPPEPQVRLIGTRLEVSQPS